MVRILVLLEKPEPAEGRSGSVFSAPVQACVAGLPAQSRVSAVEFVGLRDVALADAMVLVLGGNGAGRARDRLRLYDALGLAGWRALPPEGGCVVARGVAATESRAGPVCAVIARHLASEGVPTVPADLIEPPRQGPSAGGPLAVVQARA